MWYTGAQVCCDAIAVLLRKLYVKNNKIIKNNLVISKKKGHSVALPNWTEVKIWVNWGIVCQSSVLSLVCKNWLVKFLGFLKKHKSVMNAYSQLTYTTCWVFFKSHLPLPPLGPNCQIKVFKNSPAALSKDNVSKEVFHVTSDPFHPNISMHILHTVLFYFLRNWQGEFV